MNQSEIIELLETAREPGLNGHRALGRLIRLADDFDSGLNFIEKQTAPYFFRAARIGITGPPGCGKSTLISSVLDILTSWNKKIGILAVDPTSPYSGGAILGDRVRLSKPYGFDVFFRSMGSRGSMGGVSRAIRPASRILDFWGADIILVETVGSGQLGTAVADIADIVVAVTTPEAGDGIQSLKAGVLELADSFIVNKSDRQGGDVVRRELEYIKEEAAHSGRDIRVFSTSAINETGLEETADGIRDQWNSLSSSGEVSRRRKIQVQVEITELLENALHDKTIAMFGGIDSFREKIETSAQSVLDGKISVTEIASGIIGE